ncbi:hypothetical protein [Convivina praedatoris]|uniref:hypothetical protein n=1 Tax=Convivina praedatoris TaxID=2880963 RepID=UPI00200FFBF5|nr:hypothetical protein [Convivina sp. LMG 32447]CAH1857404.1 hypothetical protein R078138_01580 [Convivina sp. LMG 32447]
MKQNVDNLVGYLRNQNLQHLYLIKAIVSHLIQKKESEDEILNLITKFKDL